LLGVAGKSTASREYRLIIDDQFKVSVYSAPGQRAYLFEEHLKVDETSGKFKKTHVLRGPGNRDHFQIIPVTRFPLPSFDVVEYGKKVGAIYGLTLLRTRFRFSFEDGATWEVGMPLFARRFKIWSGKTQVGRIRIFREREWGLAYFAGEAPARFIACLATLVMARRKSI
jgi:hypothetical protein